MELAFLFMAEVNSFYPNRNSEPSTMVIFGASGDLTHRRLIPALYSLKSKGRLPDGFSVVGFSRTKFSHDQFREEMHASTKKFCDLDVSSSEWELFARHLYYFPGDINQPSDFEDLDKFLCRLDQEGQGSGNRIYYLAVAPQFYHQIVARLGDLAMAKQDNGWRRIVVEKPFGSDLISATHLNQELLNVFLEGQIYRIDHYLGKETAQNILFLRFANTIFEPVWNRNYVDHVQITVSEKLKVGHRGDYYDRAGVLRDMFQNHLLQLLALMTMEPPASFNADALRNETVKVLSAIRPIRHSEVAKQTIRGQYAGYLKEKGVTTDSQTATFAVVRLFIDNWRWQGVHFYLRSGKALAEKCTEIIIQFNRPPHVMFPLPPGRYINPNRLILCIQPDEGIQLRFEAKQPDTIAEMRSVDMIFDYAKSFGASSIPDAYERLLLDILQGDASLFTRNDAIELSWGFIDPIIQGWETSHQPPLAFYQPGSWGPEEANKFLARNKHEWIHGC